MAERNRQAGNPRKRLIWKSGAIVLAAAVLAVAVGRSVLRRSENSSRQAVFAVAEGPLTISVTESGTVQPREQVIIKSEVEGTTTVLYVIPEGTRVKNGDLLVELDGSKLEDAKVDQEIRVQNAEAAFISARENLEVVRNQAKSDNDKAKLASTFAREDLKKYTEGEYPNQVKEFEARITLAEEELQRAEDELHWSRILSEEKYLSESELRADELAVNKTKLSLELAQNNLALLENYTHKRALDQLKSDVQQTEMALERTRRKASANVIQAGASLKAKESEFTRQQEKLQKTADQIGKTRITAPMDGIVIYATSTKVSWRHNIEPLDEGQQVREREELIYLPTGSAFKAEIKIHESSLKKIRPGLPVRLTVDALPGKAFKGTVATIAPLPDAQSMFMNPDVKVYTTKIHIETGADVLRSGMTCKAEIIVHHYPSAIYVPIQAVVRINGQTTAFVESGGRTNPRPVEIGLDNNRMVRIVSGLKPLEKVLLAPPLGNSVVVREPEVEAASSGSAEREPEAGASESLQTTGDRSGPAPATEPPSPDPDTSPPARRGRRGDREALSPEERQKLRERYENMTPEEREAEGQRRRQMRQRTE